MRIIAAFLVCFLLFGRADAMTLEGSVEKTEVLKKRSWFARLFSRPTEGRIGIRVTASTGRIDRVHAKSPAREAGLEEGDIVVEVDGKTNASDEIHGEPGTTVHLLVQRGNDRFERDVERIDYHLITD